jgi:hypothetical protein
MQSLFGRPVLSYLAYSLVHAQKSSIELSGEFGRVSNQNSARGAVVVPVKKDRNVERTRSRTLSGVIGRAPGAVPKEEEIVIPDGSFPPLNFGPLGGEPARPSDSERGLYLHLSCLIIFFPIVIVIPKALGAISRSFGDRQYCAPGTTVACGWSTLTGLRVFASTPKP